MEFPSFYPLINETTISRKAFNIFDSTWDDGYYNKFNDKNIPISIGTYGSVKNHKTFFGSKMMKLPSILYFSEYNNDELLYEFSNDNIKKTSTASQSEMEITINIKHRLSRYLLESGCSNEFNYLKEIGISPFNISNDIGNNNSKFDNNVLDYIESNILQLYKVKKLVILEKQSKENSIDITTTYDNAIKMGYTISDGSLVEINKETIIIKKDIDSTKSNTYIIIIYIDRV